MLTVSLTYNITEQKTQIPIYRQTPDQPPSMSQLINEIDQSVATEVVVQIRCMALSCMQLFFGRGSLEMLPEPFYQ